MLELPDKENSYHKNAPTSNYKHSWNKWKIENIRKERYKKELSGNF